MFSYSYNIYYNSVTVNKSLNILQGRKETHQTNRLT